MSYTSLIQHFKRMAEGYLPEEPYYGEMRPTPRDPIASQIRAYSTNPNPDQSTNPNPDQSPQKPLKDIIYTESAVCIPLYQAPSNRIGPSPSFEDATLEIIYTLRKQHLSHGGQISFPGGRLDPNEKSEQAVAREIEEELSIKAETVELIGELPTFYLHHSKNKITPFIAWLHDIESMNACPNEVDEIIRVPHEQLLDIKRIKMEQWTLRNQIYNVPFYYIHRVPLWGATAMITAEWLRFYQTLIANKNS